MRQPADYATRPASHQATTSGPPLLLAFAAGIAAGALLMGLLL